MTLKINTQHTPDSHFHSPCIIAYNKTNSSTVLAVLDMQKRTFGMRRMRVFGTLIIMKTRAFGGSKLRIVLGPRGGGLEKWRYLTAPLTPVNLRRSSVASVVRQQAPKLRSV